MELRLSSLSEELKSRKGTIPSAACVCSVDTSTTVVGSHSSLFSDLVLFWSRCHYSQFREGKLRLGEGVEPGPEPSVLDLRCHAHEHRIPRVRERGRFRLKAPGPWRQTLREGCPQGVRRSWRAQGNPPPGPGWSSSSPLG